MDISIGLTAVLVFSAAVFSTLAVVLTWEVFRERSGADPAGHVHVAQSLYHDIATATELGIPTVWINRLGDPPDPRPVRTLGSLEGLADVLDEIVPPSA